MFFCQFVWDFLGVSRYSSDLSGWFKTTGVSISPSHRFFTMNLTKHRTPAKHEQKQDNPWPKGPSRKALRNISCLRLSRVSRFFEAGRKQKIDNIQEVN